MATEKNTDGDKSLRWCYAHRLDFIDYSDWEPRRLYKEGTGKLICNGSKKLKDVYWLIYDEETLVKAQWNAQKGKGDRTEIRDFNENICPV